MADKIILSIAQAAEAQLVEKKSRFIANIYAVAAEDEANQYLSEIRRKYKDANHHVYALQIGEHNQIQRSNDDGEPAGTAGRPILDLIRHNQLQNVMIIVTRYFGGILLGSGGLVRAYAKAASLAIEAAEIIQLVPAEIWALHFDYLHTAKVESYLAKRNCQIEEKSYLDKVCFLVKIANEEAAELIINLNNFTNGQLQSQCLVDDVYLAKPL